MDLTAKRLEELIKNTSDIEQELKQLNFQISEIDTAVGKPTDHIVPDNDPPDH
jgi:prefoldin subunit 5